MVHVFPFPAKKRGKVYSVFWMQTHYSNPTGNIPFQFLGAVNPEKSLPVDKYRFEHTKYMKPPTSHYMYIYIYIYILYILYIYYIIYILNIYILYIIYIYIYIILYIFKKYNPSTKLMIFHEYDWFHMLPFLGQPKSQISPYSAASSPWSQIVRFFRDPSGCG